MKYLCTLMACCTVANVTQYSLSAEEANSTAQIASLSIPQNEGRQAVELALTFERADSEQTYFEGFALRLAQPATEVPAAEPVWRLPDFTTHVRLGDRYTRVGSMISDESMASIFVVLCKSRPGTWQIAVHRLSINQHEVEPFRVTQDQELRPLQVPDEIAQQGRVESISTSWAEGKLNIRFQIEGSDTDFLYIYDPAHDTLDAHKTPVDER